MVGVSFWLSGGRAPHADAQSAEELLRAYVAQDTDSDGLSDWQEALYGTDPENPRSLSAELRDADAVAAGLAKPRFSSETYEPDEPPTDVPGADAAPGSLTDRFARKFLENYLRLEQSGPLSEEDKQEFIAQAIEELSTDQGDAYSPLDLALAPSGSAALGAYAVAAEGALMKNAMAPGSRNELELVSDGMTKGDEAALDEARAIGEAHIAIGKALMKVAVPREAQPAHLALANAFVRTGTVIEGMAAVKTDPILTIVSIREYDAAKRGIVDAFASLAQVFESSGVDIEQGAPGYYFFNGAERSRALQDALDAAALTP